MAAGSVHRAVEKHTQDRSVDKPLLESLKLQNFIGAAA
jgi:hypothetical protein